jgi:8-oxo-dGTP diphosphatase
MIQKIVSTGLLMKDNKVLVIQRSERESFLPGYYELPGGKVDFGEDPAEALSREFKEEVNLDVKVGSPYYTFSYISENGNRHTVEILYKVRLLDETTQPNIKLSEDHSDSKWIGLDQLEQLQLSNEIKSCIVKGFQNS